MASQVNHFKEFATVAEYESYIQPDDYAKPLVALVDETDTVMFPQGGGGGGDCGNPIMKSVDVEDYSGGTTFNGLAQITDVEFPAGITSIGQTAFYNCYALTSVSIPSGVTSIGNNAFYNCTGLTSIGIPSTVNSIGNAAFRNCTSLTSFVIPSGLTVISSEMLRDTAITSIAIPSGVTSIGNAAFRDCTSLTRVTVNATTPPTLAANVFTNTSANLVIYVPSASVETYKTTSGWSTYATQIQAIP